MINCSLKIILSFFVSFLCLLANAKELNSKKSSTEETKSAKNLTVFKLTNKKDDSNVIYIVGTVHAFLSNLPEKLYPLILDSDQVFVEAIGRNQEDIKTAEQKKSLSDYLSEEEIDSLIYRFPLGYSKEVFESAFKVPFCKIHPRLFENFIAENMVTQASIELGLTTPELYFSDKSKKMDNWVIDFAKKSKKELTELDSKKVFEELQVFKSLMKQASREDYASLRERVNNFAELKSDMKKLIQIALDGDIPGFFDLKDKYQDKEYDSELVNERNLGWVAKVKKDCVQKTKKKCLIAGGLAHILDGGKESLLNLFLDIKDESGQTVFKHERI